MPNRAHYDSVDFFTDQSLVPNPYPYFDHLRSKCPVLKTSNVRRRRRDRPRRGLDRLQRRRLFSSCIAVGGPFPPLPFTPEGSDITDQIEAHRAS